jgi:hypothetical protein
MGTGTVSSGSHHVAGVLVLGRGMDESPDCGDFGEKIIPLWKIADDILL